MNGSTRLAILASFIAAPLLGQAPPPVGPSPNGLSNEFNNMFKDMRNKNPGATHAVLNASQEGDLCKLTLTIYNDAGQVLDFMDRLFVWPCKDIPELQLLPYITNRATPEKENQLPNPFDIPFFNGGPIIPTGNLSQASPADGAPLEPRAGPTATPLLLDLPFGPPFSAGSDTKDVSGCDPADTTFFLFRVNHDDDTVTRINGCPLLGGPTIAVASRPLQAATAPDNRTVLVTSYDNAITFIDVATNQTSFMSMPSDVFPSGIAISEDGRRAYISSFIDVNPALLVIDIKARTILARIPMPYAYPQSVFLTPDDTDLFITFPLSNAVAELDTTTLTISATLAIPSPYGIAFLPSGTRAYLGSGTTPGKISILDMATNLVIGSYAAGSGPTALEVSRDGRFLAGLTFATNSLFYIDLLTGTITNGSAGSNFATSLVFLQ